MDVLVSGGRGIVNLDIAGRGRDGGAMSHWPLNRTDITRPAYRSLAQGVAAAIDAGSLRPGDRLPPHRDLAWQLGLSVQTVSRAYEELIRADLIQGQVGRGSFVKSGPRETVDLPWFRAGSGPAARAEGAVGGDPADRPLTDLSMMTPVALPGMAQIWADSMRRVADRLPDVAMSSFRPRQTMALYGAQAALWLARCGLVVPAQRIVITNGATPAMLVALMASAAPGDEIATDMLTCHTLRPMARHLHLRLRGVAADARGMNPDALIAAARASGGRMRAVFVLPSGAGPVPRIMDRDRRADLAMAAADAGLIIIENDVTGPVAPRRPAPIASLAPDRTFYITSLTKCLSPGLRVGFMAMPESLAGAALNRHLSVGWMATPMMVEIAADWIGCDIAQRLLTGQRTGLSARNRLAMRILGPRSVGHAHGLHRWMTLPQGTDEQALLAQLLDLGVALAPGAGFAVGDSRPALRLCLGGASLRDLEGALHRIAACLPDREPVAPEGAFDSRA